MDKETNAIYKGTSSIKFLNATASNYLYSLRDNKYNDFVDLLIQITNDKDDEGRAYINSRQLEILIKLQFFEEFGHNGKLLDVYKAFTSLYGRKVIQKDKISETDAACCSSVYSSRYFCRSCNLTCALFFIKSSLEHIHFILFS